MTVYTNELRRLAQKATPGPWKMLPVGDGRQKFAVADSEFLSILTVTDEGAAEPSGLYMTTTMRDSSPQPTPQQSPSFSTASKRLRKSVIGTQSVAKTR